MTRFALIKFFEFIFKIKIPHIMRFLNRKKLIILMYHGFTDKYDLYGIENDQGVFLHADELEEQIKYLKQNYNVIPLRHMIDYYINKNIKLPERSVSITIDDGYSSIYTIAYPVFRKFNVSSTVFIPTDFIDKQKFLWPDRVEYAISRTKKNRLLLNAGGVESLHFDLNGENARRVTYRQILTIFRGMPQLLLEKNVETLESDLGCKLSMSDSPSMYKPLKWSEIKEMADSGMVTIGSHTRSHAILTRCDLSAAKEEIFLSKKIIEDKISHSCNLFSYPNGKVADYNSNTHRLLKDSGYLCGLTTVNGMNNESSDLFELKRTGVHGKENLVLFVMNTSGIMKYLVDIKTVVTNKIIRHPV